jgi:hypothetical protein
MDTIDLKCHGQNCHIRSTCLRYKAPAMDNQAYFLFSPMRGGKCAYYLPIEAPEATTQPAAPVKPKRTRK